MAGLPRTHMDMIIWAMLCMTPPTPLTAMTENFPVFLKRYITPRLASPPAILKKKLFMLPKRREASMILITFTVRASLNPYRYRTVIIAIFAKPSFIPGTGKGMGSILSTYEKISAIAVSMAHTAIFWVSIFFLFCMSVYLLFMIIVTDYLFKEILRHKPSCGRLFLRMTCNSYLNDVDLAVVSRSFRTDVRNLITLRQG